MSLPNWSMAPEELNSSSPEWRVPLSELTCTEHEIQKVSEVLRSGWWTCGPETDALEREFATRLGVRHAIAVANGTAALHTLPLFPAMTYEQARLVSDCFHDAIENANVGD